MKANHPLFPVKTTWWTTVTTASWGYGEMVYELGSTNLRIRWPHIFVHYHLPYALFSVIPLHSNLGFVAVTVSNYNTVLNSWQFI